MIKKCNNSILAEKRIDEKYFLFYQIWKELTDSRTLDSYQYRIMNTLSALQELGHVINQKLNGHHNSNHNIKACREESKRIIKNDTIVEEYYPIIWNRLVAHLSETADSEVKQRALRYQIEYCYNILKVNYMENLLNSLKNDIEQGNKKSIMKKTNQLVSNCTSRGWSIEALHGIIDMLGGSKERMECWQEFQERILSTRLDEYNILMPLKVRVNAVNRQPNEVAERKVIEEIRDWGIQVKTSEEIRCLYPCVNKTRIENNQKYLLIEIQAHDYYSASHMAIGKCSNILNILSFYNLIEAWNIRDISWCAVNLASQSYKFLKAKDLYSTYDYMDRANRMFKVSKEIDCLEGSSLQARLRATYSYANMGKASYAQQEKYINTWVALESLCRTDVYENIISNVLEIAPPALCLRYIYRLFRNYIEDCNRCEIDFRFSNRTIQLNHPEKEKLVKETIEILNDDVLYSELIDKCRVNDLLVERCEELHVIATNPEAMYDKIESHYVNVRRQIRRLYRIRNEIAHTALNDELLLIRYIEHLEDYLAGVVSELVMCAKEKDEDRIEIVLEIIKDNYREFAAIKDSKKKVMVKPLPEKLLQTGIISLI